MLATFIISWVLIICKGALRAGMLVPEQQLVLLTKEKRRQDTYTTARVIIPRTAKNIKINNL
jgi:hypothetical protein